MAGLTPEQQARAERNRAKRAKAQGILGRQFDALAESIEPSSSRGVHGHLRNAARSLQEGDSMAARESLERASRNAGSLHGVTRANAVKTVNGEPVKSVIDGYITKMSRL